MAQLQLRIVTPESLVFEGMVDRVLVRTVEGDVCILPHHIDYLTALGTGEARVTINGTVRKAHCSGGMMSVSDGKVNLLSTQFEWKE